MTAPFHSARAKIARADKLIQELDMSIRATGSTYDAEGSLYRRQFEKVREEAAKTVPTCMEIGDQDLRDTAFTWMKNAGIDDDGIASRTLQSCKHIGDLGDAHYGEIGPEIADSAGRAFDAYLIKQGVGA